MTREIYDLRNPEMVKEPSESMATRIWERSDASSKAMFQPYKASAMQQWVNEMYKEDWTEGKKPDFETRPNNAGESNERTRGRARVRAAVQNDIR